MNVEELKQELEELSDPEIAEIDKKFFKTGKGQYGEGDQFIGIRTPTLRKAVNKYDLCLAEVQELLNSEIHEFRLAGVFVLIQLYKKNKKEIVDFYLKNTSRINNWDLIDISAHKIIGDWLLDKDKSILYELAASDVLWEKRIAIISTYAFIREDKFEDTLKIAEILLNDKHDLIHKAVGWMLREVGKRNQKVEEEFLIKHVKQMPRTMLRYAIERFEEEKRQYYLKK